MARSRRPDIRGEAMSINLSAISPVPTEDEAVAITAAITMMWPQAYNAPTDATPASSAWRFSGRWWDTNAISRRRRPGA